jgi:hypothetical protein
VYLSYNPEPLFAPELFAPECLCPPLVICTLTDYQPTQISLPVSASLDFQHQKLPAPLLPSPWKASLTFLSSATNLQIFVAIYLLFDNIIFALRVGLTPMPTCPSGQGGPPKGDVTV